MGSSVTAAYCASFPPLAAGHASQWVPLRPGCSPGGLGSCALACCWATGIPVELPGAR